MKQLKLIVLCLLLLLPFKTFAVDDQNIDNVIIKSIELIDKSDNTEELKKASFSNLNVALNLKFYDVNDYAKYKIIVENKTNEDLEINDKLEIDNKYIDYYIEAEDSNVVSKGKEATIYLIAMYKNEAPKEAFRSAKVDSSTSMTVKLFSEDLIVPDTLKNMSKEFVIILVLVLLSGIVIYYRNGKKSKMSVLLLLLGLIVIQPVKAALTFNLNINSNVIISKVKDNSCTFDGELSQGVEYVNGQYTYRYMQEGGYETNWNNIGIEGWGVKLTNPTSTEDVTTKLCTKINDKPIVSMSYMFFASQADNIDMSSFDTSNVENMQYMFEYAKVQELDFSSFDTSNVTNMNYMFYVVPNLNSLDLRYFDTSKLKQLHIPFYQLTNLKKLNIDNWNLSNIEDYLYLTNNFNLSVEKISAYNLKLPKNSESAFSNCSTLKTIEGTETWDMSKVENASYMFSNDVNLESINFDGLDITNVTDMSKIFDKCNNLKNIKLSNLDFSGFDNAYLSQNLSISNLPSLEILDFSNSKFYNNLEYTFSLYETPNIKELILENVDTTNVTNMKNAFFLVKYIKKLDISDFDTENVTDFTGMFSNCLNLEEINLGNIDTSNVVNMTEMFKYNYKLKEIDVSNFDTSSLKKADYMFYGNYELETINASNLIKSDIESFQYLFGSNKKIKTLIIDNWEPPLNINAGSYSLQFNGRPNVVENIYMRNWKLPENFEYMVNRYYLQIDEVNNIDVSGWDLSNTKSIAMLFKDGYHIKHISGLDTWNTSNITNMSELFKYCYVLDEVDMSSFDYSNVTRMDYMFELDDKLKTIKMGNFNAYNLENATSMFSKASGVEEIIFEMITTPKLNEASNMFYGMPKLKSLDLQGMDVSNVTDMSYMFAGNSSLEYLDLSTFILNESQFIDGMFSGCVSLVEAYARTQEDANRFNATSYKPDNVEFRVKN